MKKASNTRDNWTTFVTKLKYKCFDYGEKNLMYVSNDFVVQPTGMLLAQVKMSAM